MNLIEIYFGSEVEEVHGSCYIDVFYRSKRIGNIRFLYNKTYIMYDKQCNEIDMGTYRELNDVIGVKAKAAFAAYYNSINKAVIWFNTWFSSIVNVIEDIKEEFDSVKIIGSNTSEECTYASAVDTFYVEPKGLSPEEYLQFALNMCKEEEVTIFFPKYYSNTIAANKSLFEDIGVTVICENEDLLLTFRSKHTVYEILRSLKYDKIPQYMIANSTTEFLAAYTYFHVRGETVCCKFDRDEGAASFRVVTDKFLNYESLGESLENMVTLEDMIKILESLEDKTKFKPLMVMPKILSPEVSIDCYNSPQAGFIAIPRFKMGSRIKQVKLDQRLIDDCKRLQRIFELDSVFNVQYRWDKDGNPLLLEINTRMSGGIHLSRLSGFSIPNQVIADILNIQINQSIADIEECTLTQYEKPIKL